MSPPGWTERAIDRYTWAVAAATLLAAAVTALVPLGDLAAAIVMISAVLLVGVPHGAYDLEVGRRWLRERLGSAWWVAFGAGYVACATLGVLFWIAAPTAGLIVLLVGGAIHWGADDIEVISGSRLARLWLAFSRGTIPVVLPLLWHPDETARVFGVLVSAEVNPRVVLISGALAAAVGLAGLAQQIGLAWSRNRAIVPRVAAEVLVLVLWFAVTEPVLAFTIYFCFWHSIRHSIRSMGKIDQASPSRALMRYVKAVWLPTLLTIVAAAVAIGLVRLDGDAQSAIWRVTFIGLFALTIPHVLLELVEGSSSAPASMPEMARD
ncbi:MAG: Brp/Blh family beta-carotene 15,15'-dioxygenase [Planctomycetota bacterium]